MTKVYQTIICPNTGNCMQAAVASILDFPLEEVPNFIETENNNWFQCYYEFFENLGYEYKYNLNNPRKLEHYGEDKFPSIKNEIGINGLFLAAVYSPKYFDSEKYLNDEKYKIPTHAVIIDKEFNIIFDPNPNYKNIKEYPLSKFIGYNGIISIDVINKNE